MFSTEINNLLNDDNFQVLKLLSQYSPEKFKKDVHEESADGNSFFVSFFAKNNELDYVSNLLDLCESFEYDFTSRQREYRDEDIYKLVRSDYLSNDIMSYRNSKIPKNNKSPQSIPEYMIAFAYAKSDETFSFLTQKMGKEKMLQLEKDGWPVLEYAYRKKFSKTIEVLSNYELNYDKTPSGVSILSIVQNNQPMIDLYWKIKNEREQNNGGFMTDAQFQHFYKIIEENIKVVASKKDYVSENTIKLIQDKKDVLSKEQKESLLIKSISCVSLNIYKSIIKTMGYKQNGKEVKDIIFPHLRDIRNHEFLYFLVEDKNYLFKTVEKKFVKVELEDKSHILKVDPLNNIYGVDVLAQKLSSLGISPSEKRYFNKSNGLINRAFFERLNALFYKDESIFLEKFDNGLTLFEKIATLQLNPSSNGLLPFLNISPRVSSEKENSILNTIDEVNFNKIKNEDKSFTDEQKYQIREFLEKTWLSKNENGQMLIERVSFGSVINSDFWAFSKVLISEEGIYTNDEKLKMLESLVERKSKSSFDNKIFKDIKAWEEPQNQRTDSSEIKLLKNLYLSIKEDDKTKWLNLKLSDEALNMLEHSEFIFELKARQLNEKLRNDFHKNKESSTRSKLKV